MTRAMELADRAEQQGEVPVGAVIVYQGQIVGEGWNQTISNHDATAHAEIQALREAGKVLSNYRLLETTLYVTLEPCPMCAGAMVHSRVGEVIYATDDLKTGAAGSVMNLLSYEGVNHHVKIQAGLLKSECKAQLQAFFRRRRKEKKEQKKAAKKHQNLNHRQ
ncbi:tRNA adenosine(34) deaminase TadA [Vibrio sp. SS-MA-C1-2]|uniref:tRNA adenosine(34) deaminase TadA n=1 Tax=Vibrio sp. SS-MA-C1-2 TaxID=2908646 RepID=UPI001F1E8F73|nr:tRNA adenosine(34) deaminase TadA [Vibrio sp. SS-MA-C1-2]UJF20065.1 tRNA adenosine(34) deaminase TadA [Vibrio sp. SS-MA-C1-2]